MAKTILLVDDSPTHRSLLKVFLTGSDLVFVEAENGARALAALDSRTIDLAIVDLRMPEMDGIAFVKRVRASSRYDISVLPVIVLTGEKDQAQIAECMRSGADVCLRKPVSSAGVLEAVTKLLGLEAQR